MKRDFGIIVDKCSAIIFSFCTFIKFHAIGYQRMDPKYFLKVSGQFFSQHPTRLSLLGTDTFMKSLKDRSSHRRCSVKKGVLTNFTRFTGKHPCQSLSFNKTEYLRTTASEKNASLLLNFKTPG